MFTQEIAQIAAHIEETNGQTLGSINERPLWIQLLWWKKMSLDLNFGDIWELKSRDE